MKPTTAAFTIKPLIHPHPYSRSTPHRKTHGGYFATLLARPVIRRPRRRLIPHPARPPPPPVLCNNAKTNSLSLSTLPPAADRTHVYTRAVEGFSPVVLCCHSLEISTGAPRVIPVAGENAGVISHTEKWTGPAASYIYAPRQWCTARSLNIYAERCKYNFFAPGAHAV